MATIRPEGLDCGMVSNAAARPGNQLVGATEHLRPCIEQQPPPTEQTTSLLGVRTCGDQNGVDARRHAHADCVERDINTLVSSVQTMSTLRFTKINAFHVGEILVLELDRPEAKNAIGKGMLQDLNEQLDQIYHDHEAKMNKIRALVIGSTLSDVFCAGADLKERQTMTIDEVQHFLSALRHTFSRLASLPVPSIACVSGIALGGGLELALCCHFRVFSRNAIVGLPETKLAIIPGAGGTYRLQRVIGRSHALDMILTGRRIKAVEAAQMGLCTRLVDPVSELDDLRSSTLAVGISMAQEISKGGPVAICAALEAVNGMSEDAENAAYQRLLATRDRVEALTAWTRKRSPIFHGR